LVRIEREEITKKKLAVNTSEKTPMETVTTEATHKAQATKSWLNMLLVKSFGSKTSLQHGNLLQLMVTQV